MNKRIGECCGTGCPIKGECARFRAYMDSEGYDVPLMFVTPQGCGFSKFFIRDEK